MGRAECVMSSDAVLLAMQAPAGVPKSPIFETVTDPLLPPSKVSDMLANFPPEVYNLDPSTHLMRLLMVLLGDTGTGQLRKRYTYAHLSQFILTTHYTDLDRLYSAIFGLKRFLREMLPIDPYTDNATDAEWEAIDAADAAYRARVEAFSHAIPWAGTPNGMVMAASAILGEECRVYESYSFLDNEDAYAQSTAATTNTWADLEAFTNAELEGRTYAQMEGQSQFQGRLPNSRGEFIVRPLRNVTAEERYHLTKVLTRLKPAEALLTIDARPAAVATRLPVYRAVASSSYWHVQAKTVIDPSKASLYDRSNPDSPQTPVEQPRPAFSAYQGAEWAYNHDVVSVSSYVEDEDGNVIQTADYDRATDATGTVVDYTPDLALLDPTEILLGQAVSDGSMVAPVVDRSGS